MQTRIQVGQKKKLLLVDDDRLVLATLASGLQDVGYSVSTADSAEDAEAKLQSGFRPDLAILDVRMPGNDGIYLAHRLYQLDRIPFIMLSAYSDSDLVDRASHWGALGYCVKPLGIAQLVPVIESALARAQEIQELHATRQQLQSALDEERDVSVATGIFMTEYRLERRKAFALLRETARKHRRKLSEVASEVVTAREVLNLHASVASPQSIASDRELS